MHGSLGTFDLDLEILDTVEGDSFAEASEGFDGHDRGLGVGTGVVGMCRISTRDSTLGLPPNLWVPAPWTAPPKGQSCQHLG